MVYQGYVEILMITLISRKKLGVCKIMRNTVNSYWLQNPVAMQHSTVLNEINVCIKYKVQLKNNGNFLKYLLSFKN